jgi:hypothetical protein
VVLGLAVVPARLTVVVLGLAVVPARLTVVDERLTVVAAPAIGLAVVDTCLTVLGVVSEALCWELAREMMATIIKIFTY